MFFRSLFGVVMAMCEKPIATDTRRNRGKWIQRRNSVIQSKANSDSNFVSTNCVVLGQSFLNALLVHFFRSLSLTRLIREH
jgi:hypothetical protein